MLKKEDGSFSFEEYWSWLKKKNKFYGSETKDDYGTNPWPSEFDMFVLPGDYTEMFLSEKYSMNEVLEFLIEVFDSSHDTIRKNYFNS